MVDQNYFIFGNIVRDKGLTFGSVFKELTLNSVLSECLYQIYIFKGNPVSGEFLLKIEGISGRVFENSEIYSK